MSNENELQPPHWEPLENALGQKNCAFWMYMGRITLPDNTVIHTYKHRTTRDYINLSDDGRAWIYDSPDYIETDINTAIEKAMHSVNGDQPQPKLLKAHIGIVSKGTPIMDDIDERMEELTAIAIAWKQQKEKRGVAPTLREALIMSAEQLTIRVNTKIVEA